MIVGGTGLYIQSVLYDYTFTEEANDPAFREEMQKAASQEGLNSFMLSWLWLIRKQQKRFIRIIQEE